MKRQQDRDSPLRSRRSHSRYSAHDDSDRERLSPEQDRRIGRSSSKMSMSSRDSKPMRDHGVYDDIDRIHKRQFKDRMGKGAFHQQRDGNDRNDRNMTDGLMEYRTLCISNLNDQVPDSTVRDEMYDQFKRFGDLNVKVVHNGNFRIAYINFRYADDARDAKLSRGSKLILFDRQCRVDPVYHQPNAKRRDSSPDFRRDSRDRYQESNSSPPNRRGGGGGGSVGGGGVGGRFGNMNRNHQAQAQGGNKDFHNYENRHGSGEGSNRQQNENREKFPHHLQHILPEDDDKATRTLFVGNLDINISDLELKEIFEKFGPIEDIDIKRPNTGMGNAYAFVKYYNLDMAHRAKVNMSGQYIGRYQCKIGYGKVHPTNCLWVGGIGPWIRAEKLEAEFDRFGAIHRIEWPHGKDYAYVLYDNTDAAQAACQQMRGYPLGGQDRRIRVDFSDISHISGQGQTPPRPRQDGGGDFPDNLRENRDRSFEKQWHNKGFDNRRGGRDSWSAHDRSDDFRNPENARDLEFDQRPKRDDLDRGSESSDRRRFQGRTSFHDERTFEPNYHQDERTSFHSPLNNRGRDLGKVSDFNDREPSPKRRRHVSPETRSVGNFNRDHTNNHNRTKSPEGNGLIPNVDHVDNILDLAKSLPVVWSGALVLKSSAFSARMHLVSGDVNIVDTLMRDSSTTEPPVLKITQRLRLDQPKLDEVGRRVHGSGQGGHSVLLAMPGVAEEDPNSSTLQRPLKNLVSYLKQKEAAGVISLPPNPTKDNRAENVGVLHAFPPCQFGHDFLNQRAPKLGPFPSKDDHLIVVVVRGAA